MGKLKKHGDDQAARFRRAAEEAGVDLDEGALKRALRRLAPERRQDDDDDKEK